MEKQEERLLLYLTANKSITPLEAWQHIGVYRLSSVVHKLRKRGYEIETERVTVNNQFDEKCSVAKYVLK